MPRRKARDQAVTTTPTLLEGELLRTFRAIRLTPIPIDQDPIQFIESRRLEYIGKIEAIANAAAELWGAIPEPGQRKAFMEIDLKATAYLTRLTSVYKTRVDTTASNLGLLKAPVLANASPEQLAALAEGDDTVIEELSKEE